jgi:DNA-binding XRE family transcriptional regulator
VDGKDIKALRARCDLSQVQLGVILDYSPQFISMIESGKRAVPESFPVLLAKRLRETAKTVTEKLTNEAESIECQEEKGNN